MWPSKSYYILWICNRYINYIYAYKTNNNLDPQKDQIGLCKPGILYSFSLSEIITGVISTERFIPYPPFLKYLPSLEPFGVCFFWPIMSMQSPTPGGVGILGPISSVLSLTVGTFFTKLLSGADVKCFAHSLVGLLLILHRHSPRTQIKCVS